MSLTDHTAIISIINKVLETMHAKMVSGQFRFPDDVKTLQRQAEVAKSIEQPILGAWALTSIGGAYIFAGEFELAEQWLREALAICEAATDYKHAASCFNNLGEVRRMSGKLDEALAFYQQGLALCDKGDAATDEAPTQMTIVGMRAALHLNIGIVYTVLHRFDEARAVLDQTAAFLLEAAKSDKSKGHVALWIEMNRTLAEVALHQGELAKGWSLVNLAEESAESQGHYIYLADIALTKAHLATHDPNHETPPTVYYQTAREYIKRLGHDAYLARFLLNEAKYQRQEGDIALAHLYASEALALCSTLNMRDEALFAQALMG